MNEKELKSTGKFLSLVLRHDPEKIGLTLDENGWAEVTVLLEKLAKKGKKLDFDTLKYLVETNDKKRYSFNADFSKIRANQGHSIEVDIKLKEATPPDILYHGTAEKNLDSIFLEGLTKRNRNHVHLSKDIETSIKVGTRHGKPIVLTIDTKAMLDDGIRFYLSENQVWLTNYVEPKYISKY